MDADNLKRLFKEIIFSFPSKHDLFNQYKDGRAGCDKKDAHVSRQENILEYIDFLSGNVDFLLVGEAAGWHGCRFTGIPFTSEVQLLQSVIPISTRRTSVFPDPCSELSANIFWGTLKPVKERFFVHNLVPFHPHEKEDFKKNRTPTIDEIESCLPILKRLVEIVKPRKILGIGKLSHGHLKRLGFENTYVRHPSFGGAAEFRQQMTEIFKIGKRKSKTLL